MLIRLTAVAFVAVLSFSYSSQNQGTLFCHCKPDLAFDHTLPLSHPINRCASTQSGAVSWYSWISGKSGSYQFHFIDLLELLSRTKDYTQENKTNSPARK